MPAPILVTPRLALPLFLLASAARPLAAGPSVSAEPYTVEVSADRPDALYHAGEAVVFNSKVRQGARPAAAREIAWQISALDGAKLWPAVPAAQKKHLDEQKRQPARAIPFP